MLNKIMLSAVLVIISPMTFANWMKCYVTEAGQMDQKRIFVSCKDTTTDSAGNVSGFAVTLGTTDAEKIKAQRLYIMAQTALVSGKPMGMYFDAGATSATLGCTGACRVLNDFNLYLN